MRRPGRIARGAVRVAVALCSAAVLAVGGYAWTVQRDLGSGIATGDVISRPAVPDGPVTALLVGVDSRTDNRGRPLPPALLERLRAGDDEGQFHTDTIILLHLPADPGADAVAVSIPRDSYVAIADGPRRHKINSAYRRGLEAARDVGFSETAARDAGRRSLIRTVERLTGVSIDHFAEINLAGFVAFTDALGGVPVCLNAPVREPRSGIDLPAGEQTVRGADALAFVRQRHGLDGGDLDRIGRQQAFLAGAATTALSPTTLGDPARVAELVAVASRYVLLDRDWSIPEVVDQLARAAGGLELHTIPTQRPDLQTPVDGIAVEVDPVQVRAFVRALLRGDDPAPQADRTRPTGAVVTGTATPDPTGVLRPAGTGRTVGSTAATAPTPISPTGSPGLHTTAGEIPCVD